MENKAKAVVSLKKLLSCSIDLTKYCGGIIRSVYKTGDLGITDKSYEGKIDLGDFKDVVDPQTIADIKSQRLFTASLGKIFPGVRVVGEEGQLETTTSDCIDAKTNLLDAHDSKFDKDSDSLDADDVIVWLDPLDGTKEFTQGILDAVTVLAGISYRGKPLAGVVHLPFASPPRTVYGAIGAGVFGEVARQALPADERRWILTTRSHSTATLAGLIEKMNPEKVIKVGGAGNKGLQVLEGRADAYVFPQFGTKKWDTCAIDALITASGGIVTDAYGDAIGYWPPEKKTYHNKNGIIATRGPLSVHQTFLVPRSVHVKDLTPARRPKKTAAAATDDGVGKSKV